MNKITKLSLAVGSAILLSVSLVSGAFAASPNWSQGTVMWNGVSGATHYNIYYKESGDKMWTHAVVRLPAEARSYTITHLKRGVVYWYRVAAKKSGAEFWWSDVKRLQTKPMM